MRLPARPRAPSRSTTRSHEAEPRPHQADQATVDALRPGTALLVVLRGPNTGAPVPARRRRGRRPAGTPTATSSSTTSPSPASTRRSAATAGASSCATSASLNGTYVNRERIDEVALRDRRRGADRQVPARLLRRPGLTRAGVRRGRPARAATRRGADDASARSWPRCARTSPTSPSPRSGSSRPRVWSTPARTASGYRKFSADDVERLRYILTRPARPVLAAEGDPGRPGRHRPRPRPPAELADGAPRPPHPVRRPRRAARPPTLAAARRAAADRGRAGRGRGLRRGRRRARALRPGRRRRRRATTTSGPGGRARGRRRARAHTGSSPGTCGRSGPPPTARSGWSSRSSRRAGAAGAAGHGPSADAAGEVLRLCIALHAALVRDGLSGPRARTARAARAGYGDAVKVLDVLGVRVEMPTNQPIVLLRERDGDRYLPIWIGAAEATAIAYAQQGVEPPRPLTHDLLQERHRGAGPPAHRGPHRRAQGRGLPRRCSSSTADGRGRARAPPTPSPWRCAPAPDRRRRGGPRRGRGRDAPRARTTRSRSSASSSTTSRPRTSTTETGQPGRRGTALETAVDTPGSSVRVARLV